MVKKILVLGSLAMLVPAVAFAEDKAPAASTESAVAMPKGGEMGITVGFPTGGDPTFGIAHFLDENASLRLDLGLDVNGKEGSDMVFGFSVNGGYRMYLTKVNHLAPFVQPGVFLSKAASTDDFMKTLTVGLNAGLGAEYYFTENFSAAAMTGGGLTLSNEFKNWQLATGTTGIFANFYW